MGPQPLCELAKRKSVEVKSMKRWNVFYMFECNILISPPATYSECLKRYCKGQNESCILKKFVTGNTKGG